MFGLAGTAGYVGAPAFHEALSAAIAVIHALGFQLLGVDDNLLVWGAIGAPVHYTLARPVVAILPSVDPETNEVGRQRFGSNNYRRLDVLTSFAGHMTFGILTAILHGLFHSGGGTHPIV